MEKLERDSIVKSIGNLATTEFNAALNGLRGDVSTSSGYLQGLRGGLVMVSNSCNNPEIDRVQRLIDYLDKLVEDDKNTNKGYTGGMP